MKKEMKILLVVLISLVILISSYFLLFKSCKPKDQNKRIIVDISHSYTNPSEISDFVNYLDCEGWYVYVLDDSEISLKDFIDEKKPNVTVIFNDWYEPIVDEEQNALFEFIENGGGFLYLKPRGGLNLSRIGYFGEYESQIYSVPGVEADLLGKSVKSDVIQEITEFTDSEIFNDVSKLPNLGRPLNITEPLVGIAWSKENTIVTDTAECDCDDPYSDCYCIIKKTTEWGPFPYIVKAEFGDGKVIITSGTEEYIENDSFRDSNVKNFLMNAVEFLIK